MFRYLYTFISYLNISLMVSCFVDNIEQREQLSFGMY